MRKLLLIGLIAALMIGTWVVEAFGQAAAPATIVVRVPADARVWVLDYLTKQTGTTRSFNTPPLEPGNKYSYDVKAEVVRQGQTVSQTKYITFQAGQTIQVDFSTLGTETAPLPQTSGGAVQGPAVADAGWPRKISSDGNTITVYQPQLETWDGNRLEGRAAVSVETKASPQPTFGVIWVAARIQIDKENRTATLEDFTITKANFPAAADKGQDYLAILRKAVPAKAQTTLSLDRLEANLAVTQAEARTRKMPLRNEPPRIIFSTQPAILVLIDGKPALRPLEGTQLLRVINTRALVLLDETNGKYYLHLLDRWMETKDVEGQWSVVKDPPAALRDALQRVKDANLPVDLLDDPAPDLKAELEGGTIPTVYVSTTPAELIDTQGEPQLAPIDGTKLLWVKNTSSQIILDVDNQQYYVLLSGRWFRSKDLAKGPWEFVPGDKVPADFAKIPDTHPKGDVLASVAGTPQAKESLIANGIPQTATISRKEAKLAVTYDGDPKFEPIEDTSMQYAVNTPTPVIQMSTNSYFACENGVWFTAASPAGPWSAATTIPPAIYDIPPSNPVNYVTNVYVYGSTPDYVYLGYTPGYYGTCVAPWGGIVWGTGWVYRPWIGTWWYGRAWSYGWGTHFGWTTGGWGFAFGSSFGRPWWGPIGWNRGWGGTAWRAGWENGFGGRYNNAHVNNINFNNFNTYNRWGNNVHIANVRGDQLGNTRITNISPKNVGSVNVQRSLNNVVSDRDGNIFRRAENNWEQHTPTGWQSFRPESLPVERRPEFENLNRGLNNELAARRTADLNFNRFQGAGGFGGLNGGFSGYHAPTGFRGGGGFRGGRR